MQAGFNGSRDGTVNSKLVQYGTCALIGLSGLARSGADLRHLEPRFAASLLALSFFSALPHQATFFQHWLIDFWSSNLNRVVAFALLYFSGINCLFSFCVDILVLLFLFFYLNWLVLVIVIWIDCLIFLRVIYLIDCFCFKNFTESKNFCIQSSWYFGKIASEDVFLSLTLRK